MNRAAPSVSFYTLGCRLNQAETAILSESFRERNYIIKDFGEQTDVCVINTCSVTGQSEARCRNTIRSLLRRHPATFVIVAGCYAQVGLEVLRAIQGIDMIVGTEHKFKISELLETLALSANKEHVFPKQQTALIFHSGQISHNDFTINTVGNFTKHTRANIKIQDGCNFFCSYCIVPHSRGPSRSRKLDDIRREALELARRGHRELVITGVNIGMYASDGTDFLDVLKLLEDIDGIERIRITSIEPMTIPEGIIDYMSRSQKLCRFFHIPVQSGDDRILKRMNRRYSRRIFSDFVLSLNDAVADVHIGTDIIVGFPGEGPQEFEHSRRLLEELPLNYAHVFSFSARKGTPAADFPAAVSPSEIKQRSQILRKLSHQKRQSFYSRYIGKSVRVLFEQREKNGLFTGYTENYIKVGVKTDKNLSNSFHDVRVTHVSEKNLAEGLLL
ncbi:tRNA (N(6)-L-threonylcarbamoyladenosine(37)-C(2))-methylthiotransferase MtaB [candidate division KSB3 bacterium]|nr:MAG: tRNA (N(6)-L-threonylcarbamoyladenosine(37)-C(2))-methylthiotransferase MtaB [candidate division KSB3 bacterium]